MRMKTERGKRKVGRRLGLPEVKRGEAVRRVSLHAPVGRDALVRPPEASERAGEVQPREERPIAEEAARASEEETPRPPDERT